MCNSEHRWGDTVIVPMCRPHYGVFAVALKQCSTCQVLGVRHSAEDGWRLAWATPTGFRRAD